MKPGDKIFVIGEVTKKGMSFSSTHPVDINKSVRFVKDCRTEMMYFNVHDFILPYKRSDFIKIMKSLLPRKINRLDRVWMSTTAWVEIADGVQNGVKVEEITKSWDLVPNKRGEFIF